MICSHCGADVVGDHTYCTTCGMKLTAESRPNHSIAPPPAQLDSFAPASAPAETPQAPTRPNPSPASPPAVSPAEPAPAPVGPAPRQNGLELNWKEGAVGVLLVAVESWAFGWLWAVLGALVMFKLLQDKKKKESAVPARYYAGLILGTALAEFGFSFLVFCLL